MPSRPSDFRAWGLCVWLVAYLEHPLPNRAWMHGASMDEPRVEERSEAFTYVYLLGMIISLRFEGIKFF